MRLAAEHQRAGRLGEAAALYRAIEATDPAHEAARYNLALIALQADQPGEAVSLLSRLFREGRFEELERHAGRLGRQFPASAVLCHFLGAARLALGKDEAAIEPLSRAQGLAPRDPAILNMLGLALSRAGRHREAQPVFDRSLALAPLDYDTLVNASANALEANDADAGGRYARQALAVRPGGAEALMNLGNVAAAQGDMPRAIETYQRLIGLGIESADLFMNLGNALTSVGRTEEAIASLQHAVSLRPDHAAAHLNLGRAHHSLGETAAARRHFLRASDLSPGLSEAHSAYLFSLSHDDGVSAEFAYEEHVRLGDLIESRAHRIERDHANDRDPERDLRIGFVSADLRDHPVANFIEPVWRAIKRGRNRIVAYANIGADDPVCHRLRALADLWVQVERLDDRALCDRIRADRIDILVDLSGHTALNRLPVFAMKPAPVQMTWIGYPGTSGLSAIDYRFVRRSGPPRSGMHALFREKLVFLRSRAFEPQADAPAVNRLPALSRGFLTFGSFNRPSKLGRSVIALWSRVLRALPGSRLIIAAAGEARVQARLRESFVAEGVAANRVEFRPRVSMSEYLRLHHDVDIALDTFPYTGGTTTNHALWMGVPTLTLSGGPAQQDQAAASLRAVGLHAWATDSEPAFVAQAQAAVADLAALDRLRQSLRRTMEESLRRPSQEIGRELDAAFRTMWRIWCAGQEPASFSVFVPGAEPPAS